VEIAVNRTLLVAIGLAAAAVAWAGKCRAQEIEAKEKFGLWSLYCLKDSGPTYGKCSIAAGVQAKDNADLWTKVAISIRDDSGDLALTVRTPFLRYLRNGIAVGFDGRQAVKGIVDRCSATSCETTIRLDETLVSQIGTRDKMSVEYQVADDKSALLVLDLEQVVPALHALGSTVGMTSEAIASVDGSRANMEAWKSTPVKLVLERRQFKGVVAASKSSEAWKAPFQKCSDVPITKVVMVNSDLTLQNEREFRDWAEKSSKCTADAVAWIKAAKPALEARPALDSSRLASWTVYNYVSKFMPTGVVPGDGSRVAVVPLTVESVSTGRYDSPSSTTTGAKGLDSSASPANNRIHARPE
jgi:invasion protein IalB